MINASTAICAAKWPPPVSNATTTGVISVSFGMLDPKSWASDGTVLRRLLGDSAYRAVWRFARGAIGDEYGAFRWTRRLFQHTSPQVCPTRPAIHRGKERSAQIKERKAPPDECSIAASTPRASWVFEASSDECERLMVAVARRQRTLTKFARAKIIAGLI